MPSPLSQQLIEDVAHLHVDLAALITHITAGSLHEVPFTKLAATQRELRQLQDQIEAARLAMLPVLEADGRWALQGCKSFSAWLTRTNDVHRGRVNRENTQSRVLRDHCPPHGQQR